MVLHELGVFSNSSGTNHISWCCSFLGDAFPWLPVARCLWMRRFNFHLHIFSGALFILQESITKVRWGLKWRLPGSDSFFLICCYTFLYEGVCTPPKYNMTICIVARACLLFGLQCITLHICIPYYI
jgi:hypothetical protein